MTPPNPALAQFIRSIPLFSLVEDQDLGEVLRLFRPVELRAGEPLFGEGDPGRAMWVLGEGTEVSIATTSPQGRPVVVAYAKKGDVVGEMALVDDGPRSGTAIVVQGGPAHEIDANEFFAMRAAYAPVAYRVLRKICLDLCARLRSTNERIVVSGTADVRTPPLPEGLHPPAELVERFPAFRELPAVVKLALGQKLRIVELHEMTPLFAEGEPGDGAYFILDGEVSVGRNGKTLANLPAGTMFGVVACIDRGRRSASCVTTGPALLLKMSVRDFDQLFAVGNRFAFHMVDLLAKQLVQHVREANHLLPSPGKAPGPAASARPIDGAIPVAPKATDLFPTDAAMPLDFELNLEESP